MEILFIHRTFGFERLKCNRGVAFFISQQNLAEIDDSADKAAEEQEGDTDKADAPRHCQAS